MSDRTIGKITILYLVICLLLILLNFIQEHIVTLINFCGGQLMRIEYDIGLGNIVVPLMMVLLPLMTSVVFITYYIYLANKRKYVLANYQKILILIISLGCFANSSYWQLVEKMFIIHGR